MAQTPAKNLVIENEDLPFEEECLRNPYALRSWQRYIEHKKKKGIVPTNVIYERALRQLPGSYKLWYNYLRSRQKQVKGKSPADPALDEVNNVFERSLVFMHKMPRIWIEYCEFLLKQPRITRTRRVFDRALRSLPVTQHARIWPIYLRFLKMHNITETALRVYDRYLKLCPDDVEDYIKYLRSIDRLDECAVQIVKRVINNDRFLSKEGKTKIMYWNDLCDLISSNPKAIKSLNVDDVIRDGISRFPEQRGRLWNALADYYIRGGQFEKARDIYEEAIDTVTMVRDFTQIFDAYAQFEETTLSAKMEAVAEEETEGNEEDDVDIELRMARLEMVIERRPVLINSVLLRQNPHNVGEWHKGVELFKDKPGDVIKTFMEAVKTIEPKKSCNGRFSSIWIAFAQFYDKHGQQDDARIIFEKALEVNYDKVEELGDVWCAYAEMELKHDQPKRAIKLLQRATTPPARKAGFYDESETVQNRIYRSLKIWSFYADLEESFGTYETTKAVYDRIIDLRIATPQIIMNYGVFLEETNHFEEAFKAYEKGVGLFRWPNVYDIWNTYLSKFVQRYAGKKLERTRDLFEQCLHDCPPKFAKHFYLMYAKLEEEHGLARHAMKVYERGCTAVLKEEQYEMFNIYIKKAAELYGITSTREIYEKAIESLPDDQAREMCIRFADLERKLGEIDRARAIYAHCAQICDPRVAAHFWEVWKDFEVRHGNEDTVREMLRIKRSVQATYNTQVNFMAAQMMAALGKGVQENQPADDMKRLEVQAAENGAAVPVSATTAPSIIQKSPQKAVSFVRSDETVPGTAGQLMPAANPEEIQLDLDDDDEEDGEQPAQRVVIEQQNIPSEVFGTLASKRKAPDDEE
ncbi:pre-mRNA-splicing factor syf1 homolog [Paramacrobiotus metropolitanus]|uniref:pre-mRNA-splicing factor syf1 homolog n=1 Tax=Paramacrobiotus metropolitanus TaxID=2943436 RepID=UPI0024458DB9|nr:pre-mRNA-splicing factor syf1 homolog [Paramacrobiotus metropolitanus]